jgi:hypothetical protein
VFNVMFISGMVGWYVVMKITGTSLKLFLLLLLLLVWQ